MTIPMGIKGPHTPSGGRPSEPPLSCGNRDLWSPTAGLNRTAKNPTHLIPRASLLPLPILTPWCEGFLFVWINYFVSEFRGPGHFAPATSRDSLTAQSWIPVMHHDGGSSRWLGHRNLSSEQLVDGRMMAVLNFSRSAFRIEFSGCISHFPFVAIFPFSSVLHALTRATAASCMTKVASRR